MEPPRLPERSLASELRFHLSAGLLPVAGALFVLLLLSGCQFEDTLKSIPLLGEIYRLPDIDQRVTDTPFVNWFICHRSILTHNALLPLVVAWLCRPLKKWGVLLALIPGSLFALHFGLDLFPIKWGKYAWIHIPLLGSLDWIPLGNKYWIPTILSISWLALNMLLSQFSFLLVLKGKDGLGE